MHAVDPWQAYDLIVAEVRDASAYDHDKRHNGASLLSSAGALDETSLTASTMARRKIDKLRVRTALQSLTESEVQERTERSTRLSIIGGARQWQAPPIQGLVERHELLDQLIGVLVNDSDQAITVVHGIGDLARQC